MSAYHMNDASFELPATECVDRTLTHVDVQAPSGELISILVERTPWPEGHTLRQVAESHVHEAKKHLRKYAVLFERERAIADMPAIEFGVQWRNDDGDVYTRHAHVALGGIWLMIAGESTFADRETCDHYVDTVLGSFRLRG